MGAAQMKTKCWYLDGERISLAEFLTANLDNLTEEERHDIVRMRPNETMSWAEDGCVTVLKCRATQTESLPYVLEAP